MTTESIKLRYDFGLDEIEKIYNLPIPRLIRLAQNVHIASFPDDEVQLCTLLSVKTGGCKEDCGYCSQSAHHKTKVDPESVFDVDKIVAAAQEAKNNGSTRFCMGAAWRNPPKRGNQFDKILTAVKSVSDMGY